jgi:hypothetical protein
MVLPVSSNMAASSCHRAAGIAAEAVDGDPSSGD